MTSDILLSCGAMLAWIAGRDQTPEANPQSGIPMNHRPGDGGWAWRATMGENTE
jgi:hypothetical protein